MNIAIVPARGGSKRLFKKNIKKFFNVSILSRTYSIIKKTKIFNKIVLSTDDKQIKKIGQKAGFDLIINRNKKLSKDSVDTKTVIENAIINLPNIKFENVCCIYPCNPLLEIKDIKKCLKLLLKNDKYFVFPVTEFTHTVDRAFELRGKIKKINFLKKKNANKNTQSFIKKFHDAGQFYWGKKERWLKKGNLHTNAIGYEIPNYRCVDIDDLNDWKKAKIIFKGLGKKT